MNKVLLLGNIGSDIESKAVGDHTVYNFSMATNKVIKGEKETQWHKITAWNKTGAFVKEYFKKGDPICVEGEIKYESSGDGDDKKWYTKIVINQAHFTGSKKDSSDSKPAKKTPVSNQW